MVALHNSCSAQSKDNVRRLKEVPGSGVIFFKATERKVVFSLTKKEVKYGGVFLFLKLL
jgi:hypothetical protein